MRKLLVFMVFIFSFAGLHVDAWSQVNKQEKNVFGRKAEGKIQVLNKYGNLEYKFMVEVLPTDVVRVDSAEHDQIMRFDSADGWIAVDLEIGEGGEPAGSTGLLQYNNAGSFGALSRVQTDGARLRLHGSTSGSILLDVPSTAGSNTISFPASTGTVALVSDIPGATAPGGSSTQLQYNNAGAFGSIPGTEYDGNILQFDTIRFKNSGNTGSAIIKAGANPNNRVYTIPVANGDVEFVITSGFQDVVQKTFILCTAQGLVLTDFVKFPNVTTENRDLIDPMEPGMTIFCTDCTATDSSTGVNQTYNGTVWKNHW
jgi:hypothetical protein